MIEMNKGRREPQNERHNLVDVIPLKAPYRLNIDPCGSCNFNCFCCPSNSKNVKEDRRNHLNLFHKKMDKDLFMKIADDLEELDEQVKVIYLCGIGEPLLNPNIADYVKVLKERNLCREVRIITNGSKLTPELNQKLIDAGLDVLWLSVYGLDNATYKTISGVNFDFDSLVRNVEDFYKRSRGTGTVITAKIFADALKNQADYDRFYDVFGRISDYQEVRNIEMFWPDFEYSDLESEHATVDVRELGIGGICSGMLTDGYIHPNGEFSVCRLDWCGGVAIGNLMEDSFKNIWFSEKRKEYMLKNLEGKRSKLGLCAHCEGAVFGEFISDRDALVMRENILQSFSI